MSATETAAAAPATTAPAHNGETAAVPKQEGFRVYVGNLPYSSTEDEVRDLLKTAGGELLSVAIPTRFSGRPAGYAFAAYKTEEDAKKAVEQLDGHELGERKLLLEVARSKEEAAEARKAAQTKRRATAKEARVAEKGETTAAEGDATTEGEGKVAAADDEVKPKKKRSSKKREPRRRRPEEGDELEQPSEATGLMTDPSATAAIANELIKPRRNKTRKPKEARIDGAEGDETLVEKGEAGEAEKKERKPRKKREPKLELTGEPSKSTIFVANLPFSVDDEALAAIFTNLSIAVKSAKVVKGMRRGKPNTRPFLASKGFGFVDVEDPAQQQEAVDKVEGSLIGERKISAKIANEMKPIEKEQAAEAEPEASKVETSAA